MLILGNGDSYASSKFKMPEAYIGPLKTIYREILDKNADRMDSVALLFLGNEITYRQLFAQTEI